MNHQLSWVSSHCAFNVGLPDCRIKIGLCWFLRPLERKHIDIKAQKSYEPTNSAKWRKNPGLVFVQPWFNHLSSCLNHHQWMVLGSLPGVLHHEHHRSAVLCPIGGTSSVWELSNNKRGIRPPSIWGAVFFSYLMRFYHVDDLIRKIISQN